MNCVLKCCHKPQRVNRRSLFLIFSKKLRSFQDKNSWQLAGVFSKVFFAKERQEFSEKTPGIWLQNQTKCIFMSIFAEWVLKCFHESQCVYNWRTLHVVSVRLLTLGFKKNKKSVWAHGVLCEKKCIFGWILGRVCVEMLTWTTACQPSAQLLAISEKLLAFDFFKKKMCQHSEYMAFFLWKNWCLGEFSNNLFFYMFNLCY